MRRILVNGPSGRGGYPYTDYWWVMPTGHWLIKGPSQAGLLPKYRKHSAWLRGWLAVISQRWAQASCFWPFRHVEAKGA